jgi:nucleotide-binding universal stress UspA family protein
MYERILVAIDGSETATRALHEAIQLARALQAQVRLILVIDIASLYWSDDLPFDREKIEQSWCDEGRKLLAQGEAIVHDAGVDVDSVLRETDGGGISDAIVAEAVAWPAELIVLGTHGRRGIRHLLLGSVAEGVARTATLPVLLVRGASPASAPGHDAVHG